MSSKHSEATNVVSLAGEAPTEGDVHNPGIDFNADLFKDIKINLSAIKARTDSLKARRSLKKEWQTAWLLKAVSCIDLTTLSPQDTPSKVRRLCEKAANPIRQDILTKLGVAKIT